MPNKPQTLRTGPTVLFDPASEARRQDQQRMQQMREAEQLMERLNPNLRQQQQLERMPGVPGQMPQLERMPRDPNQRPQLERMPGRPRPGQRLERIPMPQLERIPPITQADSERMRQIYDLQQSIRQGEDALRRQQNNHELRRRVQLGKKRLLELQSQGMNQTLQDAMPTNPGQTIR